MCHAFSAAEGGWLENSLFTGLFHILFFALWVLSNACGGRWPTTLSGQVLCGDGDRKKRSSFRSPWETSRSKARGSDGA